MQVQVQAAEQIEPVTDGVQPRKGDVARADHQRNEIESQPQHHRNREEEHHRRSVHREDLVVEVRVQDSILGNRELQANQQRLDSAEKKEPERGDDVAPADRLVVHAHDSAEESLSFVPGSSQLGPLFFFPGLGLFLFPRQWCFARAH